MKNKGMHQQPNAFTPSTGGSAPQNGNFNKGGMNSTGHGHGNATPKPWGKPQTPAAATPHTGSGKSFAKSGKKAA
jgi:hypothetical protein